MQAISVESDPDEHFSSLSSLSKNKISQPASSEISRIQYKPSIINEKSSSGSYDENDYENYIEEKQECLRGDEPNPEFTNHHVFGKPKRKEKSIKEELKKANFPPIIVAKADEVFVSMNGGLKRGVRRRQSMFFCVQTAYNLLGIPEDPARIATMCGITSSEMMKASSMCSFSKTKYKIAPIKWMPKDYLKVYFQKIVDMDIISFSDETLKEIEKICDEVLEKSFDLRDEKPQTVAAAVIVFYLGLQGYAIDKSKYNDIFSRSEITILKSTNKISSVYNS